MQISNIIFFRLNPSLRPKLAGSSPPKEGTSPLPLIMEPGHTLFLMMEMMMMMRSTIKDFNVKLNFRYVKEDFILTDYSSNDHTTRSVLSIKQFQKKVKIAIDDFITDIMMTIMVLKLIKIHSCRDLCDDDEYGNV